ncbi:MAG: MoaD/ThiS family protein [Syntrophobacteraceae bacterium]|nr:MoaD/ThiS family protein [Syntrophobacteraceae bacterium]
MRIEVRLYATLRRFAPTAEGGILFVDVAEGATAADAIATVKVDADEVHLLMINGRNCPAGQALCEGDRLGLFPPIGGG